MAIPFFKEMRIGGYLIKQKLLGRKRYPLVLMLEPLFPLAISLALAAARSTIRMRFSTAACPRRNAGTRPMNAAPRWWRSRRRTLIHKEIGEIVPRPRCAQEVRLAVHQCAAAREEARSVRAVALFVLFGASRTA